MKNVRLFLALILISSLIFLFDNKGWVAQIKNIVSKPVVSAEGWIFRGLRQGEKEKKILILEEKLRQLAVEQNRLSACLEENEKARRLLGAPLPAEWKFLEARVVGISEKMRIDKGEKEGVKLGMMVISENILIGKVILVEENVSLVELIDNRNSKIPVVVKHPGSGGIQARGLLFGQAKNNLLLDRVLQNEDVQKGDLVVTSGDETWLPELLIGQIEEVLAKSTEVYKKARVSPLIDYRGLRIVFLVIR